MLCEDGRRTGIGSDAVNLDVEQPRTEGKGLRLAIRRNASADVLGRGHGLLPGIDVADAALEQEGL